jgi:hypothetical protein
MPKEAPVVTKCQYADGDSDKISATGPRRTERDDVLHADHKHKCRTRVAWVGFCGKVSCRNNAHDEPELEERPSLSTGQPAQSLHLAAAFRFFADIPMMIDHEV